MGIPGHLEVFLVVHAHRKIERVKDVGLVKLWKDLHGPAEMIALVFILDRPVGID